MEESERARLSSQAFESLARLVHRTAQHASAILRRHGLNPAQWQLLRTLRQNPGVTQTWLVEHRGVTLGRTTVITAEREECAGCSVDRGDGARLGQELCTAP